MAGTKPQMKLQIMDLLARMEAVTASATKLPLTRRAVVNPRELQELVVQLRRALPADISEALQIIRYRDTVISQAQAEASRIRAEAEQEALLKVSETQVVKDAKRAGEKIKAEAVRQEEAVLAEAEQQFRSRIQGADAYALDVLTRLEEELSTLLATTQRGIQSLREGRTLEEASQAQA